tara:strand:- start:911 stop:1339 length:429 start_codon:yes stop_codon:yes gene_type:complete
MSNCYSGKDGALSIDGSNVAMLTAWDVSQAAEVVECAYMGSTWKENKAGLLSWEGSAEANFTDSTADPLNANQLAYGSPAGLLPVGATVALIFYPDAADTNISFSGNAVVTSVENSASLGDVQTVSLSFTGTGQLVTDLTTP